MVGAFRHSQKAFSDSLLERAIEKTRSGGPRSVPRPNRRMAALSKSFCPSLLDAETHLNMVSSSCDRKFPDSLRKYDANFHYSIVDSRKMSKNLYARGIQLGPDFPSLAHGVKPSRCQGCRKRHAPPLAILYSNPPKKGTDSVKIKRRSLISIGFLSVVGATLPNEALAFQAAGQNDLDNPPPLYIPDIDGEILPDDEPNFEPAEIISASNDENFGFDGLGHDIDSYAPGKLIALSQFSNKALLYLGVEGYNSPLRISVGPAEALAILSAVGNGSPSRPATHQSWLISLEAVGWSIERVAITDFVDGKTFFGRIILSTPSTMSSSPLLPPFPPSSSPVATAVNHDVAEESGVDSSEKSFISIDVRPSDGIVLALRSDAPIFVSKKVADEVISFSDFKAKMGKPMKA